MGCVPFAELTNVPLKRFVALAFVEFTAAAEFEAVNVQAAHVNAPAVVWFNAGATLEFNVEFVMLIGPELVLPIAELLALTELPFNVELVTFIDPDALLFTTHCDPALPPEIEHSVKFKTPTLLFITH